MRSSIHLLQSRLPRQGKDRLVSAGNHFSSAFLFFKIFCVLFVVVGGLFVREESVRQRTFRGSFFAPCARSGVDETRAPCEILPRGIKRRAVVPWGERVRLALAQSRLSRASLSQGR